jgi:uncharacterized protein (UPF0128 family)
MSHISHIKTLMVEKEFLIQALKDLGYSYEEGDLEIRGTGGKKAHVAIKINLRLSLDIGFQKNGAAYEIIADWYGVRGLKKKEFTEKMMQRYAYIATRAKLEEQGFTLVSEEVGEKGKIHLVLRRAA